MWLLLASFCFYHSLVYVPFPSLLHQSLYTVSDYLTFQFAISAALILFAHIRLVHLCPYLYFYGCKLSYYLIHHRVIIYAIYKSFFNNLSFSLYLHSMVFILSLPFHSSAVSSLSLLSIVLSGEYGFTVLGSDFSSATVNSPATVWHDSCSTCVSVCINSRPYLPS